jgi:nucleotide-binding universal stress UspA family protein
VLVFPVNQNYRPFKTMVYATDFHDEDIVVLKHLIGLAEPLEANITVFHISRNRKTYEEELKKAGMEELINQKIMFREIPVVSEQAGNVTEGIKEFSKRNYADLIVLMREDKNFFQRVFGRSTTKELLRETDIPVLVYHQ